MNKKKDKLSLEFFDFNCTDFKDEKDVRIAYQKQLKEKWENDIRPPKWTSEIPLDVNSA